jgi:hypothetical protein
MYTAGFHPGETYLCVIFPSSIGVHQTAFDDLTNISCNALHLVGQLFNNTAIMSVDTHTHTHTYIKRSYIVEIEGKGGFKVTPSVIRWCVCEGGVRERETEKRDARRKKAIFKHLRYFEMSKSKFEQLLI